MSASNPLNIYNEYKFITYELKIDKLVSESVQFGFYSLIIVKKSLSYVKSTFVHSYNFETLYMSSC